MSEYLRKGELLPVKGYDLSIPSIYLKDGYGFPENMHYERGELRKRDGKSQFGQPTPGNKNIIHLSTFPLSTLAINLMAHTITNILKYNTGANNWDDITGVDMTGGATDFLDDCTIPEFDRYIFTNYIDNIRKYDNSGVTLDLGGQPPKARYCEYITPYLVIANLNENGLAIPTKIRWADTGKPEVWAGVNSGSQLLTDDATPIRRIKKLAGNLFVYKAGMIYRGGLVSTSDVFQFPIHDTSHGLYAPRALVEANSGHAYMGNQDFHINNGIRIDDIGGPIREFIFNRLNRSLNETCFALHVEQYQEVWFFITVSGQTSPTEIWKYAYQTGFWYKDTINPLLTATNYKIIQALTWDQIPIAWDMYPARWDDASGQAGSPIQVFGNNSGLALYRDATRVDDLGSVVTAKQETRDYTGLGGDGSVIGIEQDQEWMQVDFWAKGTAVNVFYSTDFGDNWTFIEKKTLTKIMERHTTFFNIIAPQVRVKFESPGLNDFFTFRSAIPYYIGSAEVEKP